MKSIEILAWPVVKYLNLPREYRNDTCIMYTDVS